MACSFSFSPTQHWMEFITAAIKLNRFRIIAANYSVGLTDTPAILFFLWHTVSHSVTTAAISLSKLDISGSHLKLIPFSLLNAAADGGSDDGGDAVISAVSLRNRYINLYEFEVCMCLCFFFAALEPFTLILFTFHSTMTLTEHLMGSNSNSVLNKWIKFYAIFSHFIKNSVVFANNGKTTTTNTIQIYIMAFAFHCGFASVFICVCIQTHEHKCVSTCSILAIEISIILIFIYAFYILLFIVAICLYFSFFPSSFASLSRSSIHKFEYVLEFICGKVFLMN